MSLPGLLLLAVFGLGGDVSVDCCPWTVYDMRISSPRMVLRSAFVVLLVFLNEYAAAVLAEISDRILPWLSIE